MNPNPNRPAARARVLVVDDHPMMRLGLRQYLAATPGFVVCGEAGDARSALVAAEQSHPDVVLLDISLTGRSGLDLLKDLARQFPSLPVLVHSMHDETIFAERALRNGARGYLMKQESSDQLSLALRAVLAGQTYLSARLKPEAKTANAGGTPISTLTDREFEVFRLIGQGASSQQVATQLHLSLKTVDAHREHMKRKLRLKGATELNLLAARWAASESAGLV